MLNNTIESTIDEIRRENSWEKNSRVAFYAGEREKFYPDVGIHLEIYKKFLEDKSWGAFGCPFLLEWPYETIPGMIHDKIVRYWIDKLINFNNK